MMLSTVRLDDKMGVAGASDIPEGDPLPEPLVLRCLLISPTAALAVSLPQYIRTDHPHASLDLDRDILHGKEARGLAAASRRARGQRMREDDSLSGGSL